MIRTKLFKKHFLLTISILVLFLILGFLFNHLLMKTFFSKNMPQMMPPVFIAKIVDRINPKDKVSAVAELEQWHGSPGPGPGPGFGPKLILINGKGEVLYPNNFEIHFDWDKISKPKNPYEFSYIISSEPPKPGFFGPPGPPPEMMNLSDVLIKLQDSQELYLFITSPRMPPPMAGSNASKFWFLPFVGIAAMIISLLLGVGFAILLIYSSLSKKIKIADDVINELKKGNLKARFQVDRNDEFGDAMIRFNNMADQIEMLVEQLKTSEKVRTKLLQELAHDLRTPIASLRNLLETLNFNNDKLDENVRNELLGLSVKEVDFFERLVEDLLFLAQVAVPKYNTSKVETDISELLEEEIDTCSFRYEKLNKKIHVHKDFETNFPILNVDQYLIKRLIRNVLDNAFSFANNKIYIKACFEKSDNNHKRDAGKITFIIEDDGPGFSDEALLSFGERRMSRKINEFNRNDIKLSVGLGSVVMREICKIYSGNILAENVLNTDDANFSKIKGARVKIILNVN